MQAWLIIERNTNHTGTAITYHGPFASPESAFNWADINCNEKADGFELVPLFVPIVSEWDEPSLVCPFCEDGGDPHRTYTFLASAKDKFSAHFVERAIPQRDCACLACGTDFESEASLG